MCLSKMMAINYNNSFTTSCLVAVEKGIKIVINQVITLYNLLMVLTIVLLTKKLWFRYYLF